MTISSATREKVDRYVVFVKKHVKLKYNIDISDVECHLIDQPTIKWLKDDQAGLFIDDKIGSRMAMQMNEQPPGSNLVLVANLQEQGSNQLFGVVFHEFGHAAFHSIGQNSENGAWAIELSTLVDFVVENPNMLGVVQDFVDARKALGMYSSFGMVKNGGWQARAQTSLEYLSNKCRAIVIT